MKFRIIMDGYIIENYFTIQKLWDGPPKISCAQVASEMVVTFSPMKHWSTVAITKTCIMRMKKKIT